MPADVAVWPRGCWLEHYLEPTYGMRWSCLVASYGETEAMVTGAVSFKAVVRAAAGQGPLVG